MDRRTPPPTEEGWFALHDFRTIDWPAWASASDAEHERAVEAGRSYLSEAVAVADSDDGASGVYAVNGHKADLLILHLRPSLEALNQLERRFERTEFAPFTDRATSYVSVTEASGYSEETQDYFDGGDLENQGLKNYIEMRLYPSIPDTAYVCFYPMSKRRTPEYNWYDLSFEERREHMKSHGDIGRDYGGRVTQMITGSIGLDDWEWGVTLWAQDATAFKDLLYEMRFDASTSKFAEFGPFYTGQRFSPDELERLLAGEALERDSEAAGSPGETESEPPHPRAAGSHPESGDESDGSTGLRGELADLGVYAGQPHGDDLYALVLYSEADPDTLSGEVDGLRGNFEHYDTHKRTAVYETADTARQAIVSLWETERAAETAAGFLSDLPGVVARAGKGNGFGTMGMFYTVKPSYREEFTEKFAEVEEILEDMPGHRDTELFANREDANDMFIASQWAGKEDAMDFFRSDTFRETVDWGREVLADRPRHVFLA